MKEKLTIIKVGGKIVEEEETLQRLLTDFAASDEKEDLINLWAAEIDMLIRRIGL